ncbi:MAG: hypothetical protein NHB32_19085 [Fischerella sp. CENA71]|nr:hypothetical protein [Fischerella sp. CENA71]
MKHISVLAQNPRFYSARSRYASTLRFAPHPAARHGVASKGSRRSVYRMTVIFQQDAPSLNGVLAIGLSSRHESCTPSYTPTPLF